MKNYFPQEEKQSCYEFKDAKKKQGNMYREYNNFPIFKS